MRFLTVGGICYHTTIGINVLLKWAVLEEKPTTALLIATTIASVVSYSCLLYTSPSPRDRG